MFAERIFGFVASHKFSKPISVPVCSFYLYKLSMYLKITYKLVLQKKYVLSVVVAIAVVLIAAPQTSDEYTINKKYTLHLHKKL